MKKVVLLGTNHKIQRGNDQKDKFQSYLERLVSIYDISVIGEEINDDNHVFSVAKSVSESLCIAYIIIEPKPSELGGLKIEQVHEIMYEFMMMYDLESESPSMENLSPKVYKEYTSRIQGTYRAREAEWLNRLQELNTWPVLVICGADHYQPFCDLLSSKGIHVVKENSYWGA